jgi:hypothetical protein
VPDIHLGAGSDAHACAFWILPVRTNKMCRRMASLLFILQYFFKGSCGVERENGFRGKLEIV